MIELLITLILFLVIVGVLLWALENLPFIDPAMKQIVRVVVIVIVVIAMCLWLMDYFGTGSINFPARR